MRVLRALLVLHACVPRVCRVHCVYVCHVCAACIACACVRVYISALLVWSADSALLTLPDCYIINLIMLNPSCNAFPSNFF